MRQCLDFADVFRHLPRGLQVFVIREILRRMPFLMPDVNQQSRFLLYVLDNFSEEMPNQGVSLFESVLFVIIIVGKRFMQHVLKSNFIRLMMISLTKIYSCNDTNTLWLRGAKILLSH